MTTLENKVAFITDYEHFAGHPAAQALLDQGARVYATDATFSSDDARAAAEARHPGLIATEGADPVAAAEEVLSKESRVDILINNDAFPALKASIDTATDEDFGATLEALVQKPFRVTRTLVPAMKQVQDGRIIFVTSAAPLNGLANYAMYASARGAANSLMLSLARELAPANIHVNAVAPNFLANPDYYPPELMANEKAAAKILSNIPLGRLGKPEEVGALIAFLAGPGSGFVTGQVIPFSGGWANVR